MSLGQLRVDEPVFRLGRGLRVGLAESRHVEVAADALLVEGHRFAALSVEDQVWLNPFHLALRVEEDG
jgi:hypothetical protein